MKTSRFKQPPKKCKHIHTTSKDVWIRIEHVGPTLDYVTTCQDCGKQKCTITIWKNRKLC